MYIQHFEVTRRKCRARASPGPWTWWDGSRNLAILSGKACWECRNVVFLSFCNRFKRSANIYLYIYIYVYVYIYIFIHMYTHIYIYIHIWTKHIYMQQYSLFAHRHANIDMCIQYDKYKKKIQSIYVRYIACIYIYIQIYIYLSVYVYKWICI